VRLNEFLADTQETAQGVIVGQANWQQQLENTNPVRATLTIHHGVSVYADGGAICRHAECQCRQSAFIGGAQSVGG
jgi:hypothetical protein